MNYISLKYIYIIGFIPMLNSINKSIFCVVQLFRDIPVGKYKYK